MKLYLSLIILLGFIAAPSITNAEQPKAGQIYQGPKTFFSAEEGVGFRLPKGAVGGLEGEYFMIGDPVDQGKTSLVLLWSVKGAPADARKAMQSTIPINGSMLKPTGKVAVKKHMLTAHYSIAGEQFLTNATITTRVQHGRIVAVISVYGAATKKKTLRLGAAILASLTLAKPKAAVSVPATASKDTWLGYLRGASLTRFYNGSGYSEKEVYTFCPNGSFYRSFNASSASQNGTGAADAHNRGSWTATGTGNRGTIVLRFKNGSVDNSPVVYRDSKTFWGGTRYFYQANQCR